jgi:flagellar hook protein FlgE
MTINSALLAGVTGLTANASALAGISENIANANTIGYKRVGVDFADLVNSNAGSSYSAGGLTASTHNLISQQGTLTASGSATDLAISGGGFFVTSGSPNGATTDGLLFTRAGSFNPDANGYLKNSAGLYLQGWPTNAAGEIQAGTGASSLGPINLLQYANSAQASSNAAVSANLNSDTTGQDLTSYSTAALPGPPPVPAKDMAMYAIDPLTGIKPDFSIQVPVNDSLGGTRNLVMDFVKDTTAGVAPNTWKVEVRSDPPSDIANPADGTTAPASGLIASGSVHFNSDGTIDMSKDSVTHASVSSILDNLPLSVGASDPSGTASATGVQWNASLGISASEINVDLTGLTQLNVASATNKVSVDGTPSGSLSGVSVDDAGIVTAIFANGSSRKIAQLAVATFTNPDGLSTVSGDSFGATSDSGAYTLKAAGTGGAGKIAPSSLESSTVDLSTEFTGLITTQRAYTACSKIITTADQMLEQLLSIKQ